MSAVDGLSRRERVRHVRARQEKERVHRFFTKKREKHIYISEWKEFTFEGKRRLPIRNLSSLGSMMRGRLCTAAGFARCFLIAVTVRIGRIDQEIRCHAR